MQKKANKEQSKVEKQEEIAELADEQLDLAAGGDYQLWRNNFGVAPAEAESHLPDFDSVLGDGDGRES